MERDGFQMYKRHMIPKGLGHPLWIPQANMRLPVPYRQAGVCIGDVGIITREGAFDCLFNICLPLDHPINSSLLPDDFAPLHPPLDHQHIIEVREFSSNAYLASNDIYRRSSLIISGINFTTSAPEGAILTMPRGAYVQRLANEKQFDDYIANNAETWYKIANERLRRDAKNGDLRIVLGCHKSTAWGMATFVNRTQYSSSRAQSLRFITTKVGPEADDNVGLFDGQFQDLRNQCLFVRAPVMTLNDQAWLRISQQSEVRIEENGQSSSSIRQPDASPRRTSGSLPNPIPSRSLENRGRQSAVSKLA
ncbi:hypothetical protein GALMADRAFT_65128 [Galerina marginata CBS 339.88]|uniref:Uncharacterized protein n=1 Tax=Galerina marginata (strain CBS 339.88) TaxID=685588 RepID=A0A067T5A5_GALM3|nr:hypothetical protein GALMADRAFT_65128 [Galerina marginata CBS 339.88]